MIAGAFSYPRVSVSVLAAPFARPPGLEQTLIQQPVGPLSHAILEVLAAIALLFGVAVPMGRRLSTMAIPRRIVAVPAPRAGPMEVTAQLPPPLEFTSLREQAAKNVPGVARLLQSWVDDLE
jgi:flagellar M-ring protein FliF